MIVLLVRGARIHLYLYSSVQKCTCWKVMALAPVGMKIFILWDVKPCRVVKLYRHVLQYCSLHASVTFETRYIFKLLWRDEVPCDFCLIFQAEIDRKQNVALLVNSTGDHRVHCICCVSCCVLLWLVVDIQKVRLQENWLDARPKNHSVLWQYACILRTRRK
jgi:hypothetical protein